MIKSHKKQVQPRGGGRGDQESQKNQVQVQEQREVKREMLKSNSQIPFRRGTREREVPATEILLEQESRLVLHSSHSSFFIMSSTVILHRWIEPPTTVDLT